MEDTQTNCYRKYCDGYTYKILIYNNLLRIEAMKIAHIPHMTWFIEHGDAQ